ncbi:hypothetical protein B296_00013984 [Ensete ventricosum]|uniref:Uncharacterized protein n=1 Tax=Ensete ventricosum TaxID=4639 RepID=A0A426Y4R0_ENSVE|nr:hypothetical protein B296_00013984 [Ensete ventricosum]
MLEERRAKAYLKNLRYHRAVPQLYNQIIQPRPIGKGDRVLRRTEVSDPRRTQVKLALRWEGLYRVIRVIRDRTYILSMMEGRALPRTWHVSNLKKFYV